MERILNKLMNEINKAKAAGKKELNRVVFHPYHTNCKKLAEAVKALGYSVRIVTLKHYSAQGNATNIIINW